MARELIVGGPVAHQKRERVEVVIERAGQRGRDEMRGLHVEADLIAVLPEAREIRAVAEKAGEPFGGGARRAGQLGRLAIAGPLLHDLAALVDAYAVAEVVGEDDVEA